MAKLWTGRFAKETDHSLDVLNASLPFDQRLYRQDITGSMAHAKMLARQGIISAADGEAIVNGLQTILDGYRGRQAHHGRCGGYPYFRGAGADRADR